MTKLDLIKSKFLTRKFFRSWFSGIFGFFFSRAVVAIASFAIILLLILLPFFKRQLWQMVEDQGQMLANSTIAANTSNLYKTSYGDVVEYLNKVLKDTHNILFVVVTDSAHHELLVSKDRWNISQQSFNFDQVELEDNHLLTYQNSNPVSKTSCFLYHQTINIGGAPWGVLTIGMSDEQYVYIKNRYSLIVAIVSILLVMVLSFLFYRSSKKIRLEIAKLSEAGYQLQAGNLSARATELGLGEIGHLSKAINTMAINLQSQINRTKQLAQIVEQTNDAFVLFDSKLNIIFVNDAIEDVTGYPSSYFNRRSLVEFSDALNLSLAEVLYEIEWISLHSTNLAARDIVITHQDTSQVDVEMRVESIANIELDKTSYLIVISNISGRKKLENELHKLAFYDKLTDLPNRRMFIDYLRKMVDKSKRSNERFALFFIDLDNFKFINDSLGHEAGDKFLVEVGNKLRGIFRSNDMVTRLGGDEFTILIDNVSASSNASIVNLAGKLVTDLAKNPIYLHGRAFSINASVGVAIYPEHGEDSDTLLKNADVAMYSAKKLGKNRFALFTDDMQNELRHSVEIENDLKQAIKTQSQLVFNYQPIVSLIDNTLIGLEALARWNHPEKGLVSPIEFIPIAEHSDLIIQLSYYLLDAGIKQLQDWYQKGFSPYLSINISVLQFKASNFIERIQLCLDKYQITPSNIQLEFTESIMIDIDENTVEKFAALKKLGFKIAIDDFGTGYSSLGYIHKLPIDVIKIDKSFISSMANSEKTHAIVSAIVKLSSSLGIKTIAEGIEHPMQATELLEMGGDYGQGYLYNQALSAAEVEDKYLSLTPQKRKLASI